MQFAKAAGMRLLGAGLDATAAGIEFEVEGAALYSEKGLPPMLGMDTHADGSLRGVAYEFVTRPAARADMEVFVRAFCASALEYGFTYSSRTSTHIHINVRDLTCEGVALFVAGCAAVEGLLSMVCKEQRRNSLFCVPIVAQVSIAKFLGDMIAGPARWGHARPSIGKYSSLSTHRLFDLGTIEYRVLHGTNQADRVLVMLDALLAIKEWARSTTVAQALDTMLRPAGVAAQEILGDTVLGALHAHSLAGPPVADADSCMLLARASLLAAKLHDTQDMLAPVSVADKNGALIDDNHLRTLLASGEVPRVSSQLRALLEDAIPGDTKFGFTAIDDELFKHTFLVSARDYNRTDVYTATYRIKRNGTGIHVFDLGGA